MSRLSILLLQSVTVLGLVSPSAYADHEGHTSDADAKQGMHMMMHHRSTPPTVSLSVTSQQATPNDLASAIAYYEATDRQPAELARKVNAIVADALRTSKSYANVKVRTLGTQTFPIYNKPHTQIEAWRMRSTIALESRDVGVLSELLGKLQNTLAVGSIDLHPSPEALQHAQDAVIAEGLKAFQARAQLASQSLGKKYRVKEVSINPQGGGPILYKARMSLMADQAAPAPIEAGESETAVIISGTIELID